MKLQKQISRKIGNEEYSKWVIVIPSDKIKELGWREGMELDSEIKEKKIILKPKKE